MGSPKHANWQTKEQVHDAVLKALEPLAKATASAPTLADRVIAALGSLPVWPANDTLRRLYQRAVEAIRNPANWARAAAEIWQYAADHQITVTEALERLVGGSIQDIPAGVLVDSPEFNSILRRGPIRDLAFASDNHGAHTHLFQEYIINMVLGSQAGAELRQAISEVSGGPDLGKRNGFSEAAWDGLFDDFTDNMHRPEATGPILMEHVGLPRYNP